MDELVKRNSLSDVVGYAKLFPVNDYCKHLIEQFTLESHSKMRVEISEPANRLPEKWTEIYNRLFELINDRNNSATYFSDPRFINLIKEFSPYFPDYQQFIDSRNAEGKSMEKSDSVTNRFRGRLTINRLMLIMSQITNIHLFRIVNSNRNDLS